MKHKSLLMIVAILIIAMSTIAQVTGIFTDSRDGKTYKTVKIGTQTWMAENLAYKTSSGCWAYNDDQSNVATYGYLYDWQTAKNACPAGWHLPSDAEWSTLINYVGAYAGMKLKSSTGWYNNGNGTDDYGFAAFPGGWRGYDGQFYPTVSTGYWWTSTASQTASTIQIATFWIWEANYFNSTMDKLESMIDDAHSVRCVRDDSTLKEKVIDKPIIKGTFTDPRDSKIYKTVKIGTQTWMAENLAYKASSGCWAYNNDQNNVAIYGYLYDWETAKVVCPIGWHLPSDIEWQVLVDYLGGSVSAGKKTREVGTTHWKDDSYNADNTSGFTALPAGERYLFDGVESFGRIKERGTWWSSTKGDDGKILTRLRNYSGSGLASGKTGIRQIQVTDECFSVRCIKDK